MALSNDTLKFLEQFSQNTVKDSNLITRLEQQLEQNPKIYNELSQELDKLFVETEEDLSTTFSLFAGNLNDIKKVYEEILNKYDLQNLLGLAIECLNQKVRWQDIEKELCLNALRTFLENIDIDKAEMALSTLQDLSDVVAAIIPLTTKQKQNSERVNDFIQTLENSFDIEDICNEISLNVDNFASLINFSDLLSQNDQEFRNRLPDVPTFEFPDNLPTVDFLQSIREQAEQGIEDQVLSFIVNNLSLVLQQIIQDQCVPNDLFGVFENIGPSQENIRRQLRSRYGGNEVALASLIDATTRVLTVGEFCALLKGRSSSEVFEIIKSLVEVNYPDLRNLLKDEESILDLFVLLSNAIELDICEDILTSRGQFGPCFNNDREELRECLLKDQLQQNKINDLLEKIRKNNEEDLKKLFELLKRTSAQEINLSNLCKIDQDIALLNNLQKDFTGSALNVLDSVLTTVGISYDQAVSSYVSRLLKDVDVPTRDDLTKRVPVLVDNVVNKLKQTYNDQFTPGLSEFSDQGKELKGIIENSIEGQKSINSYIDLQKAEEFSKANSLFAGNRKKVQPDLKAKLEDGSFIYPREGAISLNSNNNTLTFTLPEKDTSKTNQVFEGKLFSSVLPVATKDILKFKTYAEKNRTGEIVETCQANYISTEQRLNSKVFQEVEEKGCNIYKVYLPICFGLAQYKELYKTGIFNSQPLFPNYVDILQDYFPQLTPYDGTIGALNGLGLVNHLKTQSKDIINGKYRDTKTRLLQNEINRYWPYALQSLDSTKNIDSKILGQKISEYLLYRDFYDTGNVRGRITGDISKEVPVFLERHWIENVWSHLRVAYYYKIYETGEAYLVKIDLNEKISTTIDKDDRYGGPKMNVEDYASYNVFNIGQKNWKGNNLHGEFKALNQNFPLNPLVSFAGLQTPMQNAHESRNEKAFISSGVIEYQYGIPANIKARRTSWTNGKTGVIVERFGPQYSLIPTYLGNFARMTDQTIVKEDGIKGLSDPLNAINFNDATQTSLLTKFDKKAFSIETNSRDGKARIPLSAIPLDPNISKGSQIQNILDIGADPLKILEAQGKKWFPGLLLENSREKYEIKRAEEAYKAVQSKDVDLDPQLCVGYTREGQLEAKQTAQWRNTSIKNLSSQRNKRLNLSIVSPTKMNFGNLSNIENQDNVFSHVWANLIIKSIKERFPTLSSSEIAKIREFYTKKGGFLLGNSGFVQKFADYIATSPIFQSFETTNQKERDYTVNDTGDNRGLNETNLLELVNFTPKFTSALPNCDIDLDLMRLAEIRREVVTKYEDIIQCFSGDENIDQRLNLTIATATIKILIRLYAIELVLGSIFFFSRFDLELNDIDDLLAEFVAQKILDELQIEAEKRNDVNFVDEFLEIIGGIFLDETKQDLEQIDCKKALNELCRKQISLVSARLKQLLYTPTVIKNNSFKLNDVFSDILTPFVDLPLRELEYKVNKGRFISTDTSKMTDLQKKQFSRFFVGFNEIQKRSKIYDVENIGFYFEKYVKPKYKNVPQDKVLSGIVSIEAFENWLSSQMPSSTETLGDYLDELKVGMRLMYRPIGSEFQLLKSIIKPKTSGVPYDTKDYYEPGLEQLTSDFFLLKQVINTKYKRGINSFDIRFELYWEVQNEQDYNRIQAMLRGKNWDTRLLTEKNEKEVKIFVNYNNGSFEGSFEKFIQQVDGSTFKNENIVEFLDGLYGDLNAPIKSLADFRRGFLSNPIPPPNKFRTLETLGESILLPMIATEENVDLECKISEIAEFISTSFVTTTRTAQDDCQVLENQTENRVKKVDVKFQEEYDRCFSEKFKKQITISEDYRLIFENIFSLKKLSNILVLYILLYNRNTTNILDMFNNVKSNLFSFLENVNNLDEIRHSDSKLLEFGGDSGIFSPNSNIISQNPEFARLFDLNSIRNSTPYVILKSLMETFDPNIAPSKKIADVANNYKREIVQSAEPFLELVRKREDGGNLTQDEIDEITASQWLIDLANNLNELPDLPVHIPSVFFMVTGIIPSPLGFAYLGFESILGSDLLQRIQNNSNLKAKIEAETGVSIDAAKEFVNSLEEACLGASR